MATLSPERGGTYGVFSRGGVAEFEDTPLASSEIFPQRVHVIGGVHLLSDAELYITAAGKRLVDTVSACSIQSSGC